MSGASRAKLFFTPLRFIMNSSIPPSPMVSCDKTNASSTEPRTDLLTASRTLQEISSGIMEICSVLDLAAFPDGENQPFSRLFGFEACNKIWEKNGEEIAEKYSGIFDDMKINAYRGEVHQDWS